MSVIWTPKLGSLENFISPEIQYVWGLAIRGWGGAYSVHTYSRQRYTVSVHKDNLLQTYLASLKYKDKRTTSSSQSPCQQCGHEGLQHWMVSTQHV